MYRQIVFTEIKTRTRLLGGSVEENVRIVKNTDESQTSAANKNIMVRTQN